MFKCIPLNHIKEAWFDHTGIANIYLFAKIVKLYPTAYNRAENRFDVKTPSGVLVFRQSSSGLYYNDVRKTEILLATITEELASEVVPMVEENESFFTKR